jgi:ATP-dependent helicase/nuclease subunit A
MVGDVKQSVYKFRQSRPQIFIRKRNSFSLYDSEKDSYPAKIILGQNFRSKEGIINGVNFIFGCLMSEKTGDINYTNEEILVPGAIYPQSVNPDVSFKMIDISETGEGEDENTLEAQNIAETIMEMIAQGYTVTEGGKERPVTYSDFCVLLRSANSYAHIYAREIYRCGIPSWSETNEKFLGTKEISTMVSILQVISNPVQDIPLISALTGPIFGFTVDELSKIRQAENGVPFYFALKKYAQTGEPKVTDFLEKINGYRQIAGTMPCDELIDRIYYDTDYPAICAAMPKGEIKKANLALLSDYARKFENQYHKGLAGFLNFLENISRKGSDLTPASISDETENTVKIMSIHKSKGLEFPICIVAGCSRKFNFDKDSFNIHPELGIGMKLKDSSGTLQYDNFIRQSIALKNKKEDVSEELRILYVALTRAKQKLIILASLKDPQKSVQKNLVLASSETGVSPYIVGASSSFTDWILLCFAKSGLRNKLCSLVKIPEQISDTEKTSLDWNIELISKKTLEADSQKTDINCPAEVLPTQPPVSNKELAEKIKSRFNFEYPRKSLTNLPLKISASQLAKSGEWEQYIATSRPAFMSSQSLTPSDKGTAMHKFMCCADFKNVARHGIYPELDLLVKKGFLSKDETRALNLPALKKFTESELFRRMSVSPKLLREHRFSVKIPPNMLDKNLSDAESENFIVTQGAVDCAFLEDDAYVIVDYKTDKTADTAELFNKYSKQLELYKYAVEHTEQIKVKELIIYSFYLSEQYTKR